MAKKSSDNSETIGFLIIMTLLLVVTITFGIVISVINNTSEPGSETNEVKFDPYSPGLTDPDNPMVDKPIIYLYPTQTTDVSVKVGKPEQLTVSYPDYSDGWQVTAQPNGDLTDKRTGRQLYSLYYESQSDDGFTVQDDGFMVSRDDTVSFLEDKLAQLGLNEREAEEFIVYWLPRLQQHDYNYIRFATADEINQSMPLSVNPQPDTIIRVLMTYKGLDQPIDVTEQQLPETPTRQGFTLVEWGGSEIID